MSDDETARCPEIVHGPCIDEDHIIRQRDWSKRVFGPGPRTGGILQHIRLELDEIAADPTDLAEWVDVLILALDGAWRAGHEPHEIIAAVHAKQARNENRTWPDWREASEDAAIEHIRGDSTPVERADVTTPLRTKRDGWPLHTKPDGWRFGL